MKSPCSRGENAPSLVGIIGTKALEYSALNGMSLVNPSLQVQVYGRGEENIVRGRGGWMTPRNSLFKAQQG